TRYEEVPSVLVEAMAAGLPVIASRVGGIPALVADGVNGLLVPPGDPAALAEALARVLSDPATAGRLSAAARSAAAGYTWPALARRVAALYQEVAHCPGTPALGPPGERGRSRVAGRPVGPARSAVPGRSAGPGRPQAPPHHHPGG